MAKNPDPIDVEVGGRIRLWRKANRVTQMALAAKLGLTFQQIQKYEKGANRVSASMLVRIAKELGTTVGALVGEQDNLILPTAILRLVSNPGAPRLLEAYAKLPRDAGEYMIAFLEKLGTPAISDDFESDKSSFEKPTHDRELVPA